MGTARLPVRGARRGAFLTARPGAGLTGRLSSLLALDVAILVIAPLVAGLLIADRWDLNPEQERVWSAALVYATSYAAVCYAMLVATRRVAFSRPGVPEGALTLAALMLGAEARRSHPLLTVLRGSECLLGVPLRRGQRAVGVLVFSHTRNPAAFRPQDVARAEVLANQAAVALRNAELFQYVRRGLDEM